MKIKNTFLILITALFFLPQIIIAQFDKPIPPEKIEQMRAQRVAFLTDFLDLTVEEAQRFWPVYNEQQKKTDEIFKQKGELHRNLHLNIADLDEKELEEISDKLIEFEQQILEIKLESHKKYKKALPIKKLILFYQAEDKFKLELLKKIRDRPNRPPGF